MIFRLLFLVGFMLSVACRGQVVRVVVDGDSLFSSNNGLSNWTQFFDPSIPLFNNAAGGDLLTNIIGEFPSQDAPLACPNGVFILEGGTGDLGAGSTGGDFQSVPAAQVYSNALNILSQATNAGFSRLFLCTVAPSASIPAPTKDQNRQDYNSLVRGGVSNGYSVIDTDAVIGSTNDPAYYQSDGIHWSESFEAWLGLVVVPAAVSSPETRPQLSLTISNGLATVSWTVRAYATNTMYQATDIDGPWVPAVSSVEASSRETSVSVPATGPRLFFRLSTQPLDYPTFLSIQN